MKKKTLLALAAALGSCLALALCLWLLFAAGVFGARGTEPAAAVEVTEPAISARGAILIDAKDGSVLYEKNAHEKMYPASTTKIMTALVVLQILDEIDAGPDSHLVVPAEAAGVEGSSLYLEAGERLTVRELMYGLMLQSGNDAACALAVCCGGSMESFVARMNEEAAALGCNSTHFTNPHGLADEEHYTTAADLARISMEAMKNEDFRRIVAAREWQSEESGRSFVNKNKTLSQYEGATGVKIGYTMASGRTLVASAAREGRELIAVVLDDHDWFADAYALLDYGFSRLGE